MLLIKKEKFIKLDEPIDSSRKNQKKFEKMKSRNKRKIWSLKIGKVIYVILYYIMILTPFILYFQSDEAETYINKIVLLSACIAIITFVSSSRATFNNYYSQEMDKLAERFIYPIEPKSVKEIEHEIKLLLDSILIGKTIDRYEIFTTQDSDKKEGFIIYH